MSVLVAVPTRGQIQWQTVTALQAARDYDPSLPPVLYQEGGLSVALTRNRIVKRFLETSCDVLAMVDDDVAPPVNFVELLLPHMGEYAMVAIPHAFAHQNDPGVMSLSAFESAVGGLLRPTSLWTGVTQCDAVATGCAMVTREALEQLGPAPFRMAHDPDDTLQSDDFLFCADLRTAGFKIGAYWDGHPADHFRVTSQTPLWQSSMLERSTR